MAKDITAALNEEIAAATGRRKRLPEEPRPEKEEDESADVQVDVVSRVGPPKIVPLSSVTADHRKNTRDGGKTIDQTSDDFRELRSSIAVHGVLQPIVVREIAAADGGARYEVVAGYRRYTACVSLGLVEIPVVPLADSDDRDATVKNLIENLQRSSVSTFSLAKAFYGLKKKFKMKGTEIAKYVSRDRSYVNNLLRAYERCDKSILEVWEKDPTVYHLAVDLATKPMEEQLTDPRWLGIVGQPEEDGDGGAGNSDSEASEQAPEKKTKKLGKKQLEELLEGLETEHPTEQRPLEIRIRSVKLGWVEIATDDAETRYLLKSVLRAVLGTWPPKGQKFFEIEELSVEEDEEEAEEEASE